MFLVTLGMREWQVRDWAQSSLDSSGIDETLNTKALPKRNCCNTPADNERKKFLLTFLKNLPTLPSHYCRATTNKLYLEPPIMSVMVLYRLYEESFKANSPQLKSLSRTTVAAEFEALNLAIYSPKIDQCDTCHISDKVYNVHQQRKEEARSQKAADKANSIAHPDKIAVFTMDVQAVKMAPFLKANAFYYKTKLCVHNFTIYSEANGNVTCYLWNESEGGLDGDVFASMISDHVTAFINSNPTCARLIMYSDSCCYQNRNAVVSNALLAPAIEHKVTIEQHYLEKGHTQMEVDSVHSTIEHRLRNKEIYLPTDYVGVCREACVNDCWRDYHQYL